MTAEDAPAELRFGTSGLRGLVREMTDREVYVNVRGWLEYLRDAGELLHGEPVALAEDLREVDPSTGLSSSPRIGRAVATAVRDGGFVPLHCGKVPTPALASFAAENGPMPAVMVTGSHIPADRNGVKFYRKAGEILKAEEPAILDAVARARRQIPALFDGNGMFLEAAPAEPVTPEAARAYVRRYVVPFAGSRPLEGLRPLLFEHSAVGRDLVAEILRELGADVICEGRTDSFVPVDTEDVGPEDEARFAELVRRHGPDAIVSTDGDGDRPLVVDEKGRFHRGDMVGLVTAEFLGASFAAVPVSTTDALDRYLGAKRSRGEPAPAIRRTRIGSPYVIAAMLEARREGREGIVGWEANGGFLTASDFRLGTGALKALPTRDALLPILAVLLSARKRRATLSELFGSYPQRATRSGLLDGFPVAESRRILGLLGPNDPGVTEVTFEGGAIVVLSEDGRAVRLAAADEHPDGLAARRALLARFFSPESGFGAVVRINYVDGVRIFFENGDIAHLRPSGNAPQLRIYAVSDTDERAEHIVREALREPDGVFRRMERELGSEG